jgi:hypothetical protein
MFEDHFKDFGRKIRGVWHFEFEPSSFGIHSGELIA